MGFSSKKKTSFLDEGFTTCGTSTESLIRGGFIFDAQQVRLRQGIGDPGLSEFGCGKAVEKSQVVYTHRLRNEPFLGVGNFDQFFLSHTETM